MAEFQYVFDVWAPNGTKTMPSTALKNTGFVGGMKPPASVFNYQWDKIGRAISELQEKSMVTGDYTELINTVNGLAAVAKSGNYNDLLNKPALHAVATSGKYADLTGRPNVSEIVFGSYSGDGNDTKSISLGYSPTFVLVWEANNNMSSSGGSASYFFPGISIKIGGTVYSTRRFNGGYYNNVCRITNTGFEVSSLSSTNISGSFYAYLVIK